MSSKVDGPLVGVAWCVVSYIWYYVTVAIEICNCSVERKMRTWLKTAGAGWLVDESSSFAFFFCWQFVGIFSTGNLHRHFLVSYVTKKDHTTTTTYHLEADSQQQPAEFAATVNIVVQYVMTSKNL